MNNDFSKTAGNGILRESITPNILISLLCHVLFLTAIVILSKAIYKSKEFDRPHTFDLIKLSQVFEEAAEPAKASLPKLKTARPKAPAPAEVKPQPAPVKEQNPVPSENKTAAPAPAETPPAPQAASGPPGPVADAAAAPDKIYEEGTVDGIPQLIKHQDPFYPEFVREEGISGVVKGWAVIDKDGTILQVKITSSPHELLSEEVVKSVARWKYKPATFKGVPVKMKKQFEINFKLEE